MPASISRTRANAGFTLVEVLVALVVTSLLLAIVMNAAISAKTRSVRAAERAAAVQLAGSLVAEQVTAPFTPAGAKGKEGGLSWSIEERQIARDPRGFFLLSEISVAIDGKSGARLFDATTRKVKPVPAS
jgi:prepilin-type N-terminal cleavage/methylation domain-containing protein